VARQRVAWVAQQQEERLHKRFDFIENLLTFGHRQSLPVPPVVFPEERDHLFQGRLNK
jgi:hypothetical protein